jgi:DNA-binding NarL/FixJ family response regulator
VSGDLGVVVADGSPTTRAGLRSALRGTGVAVVGEAASAGEALASALTAAVSVCIVDAALPGGGFERALEQIALLVPQARTVVMAAAPHGDELLAVVRGGGVGYVDKDVSTARLPAILLGVAAGETALPRTLVGRLVDELRLREEAPFALPNGRLVALSGREREVAAALQRGASTRDLASHLGISEVTVRRHISALMRKLDVGSRDAAAELLNAARTAS